MAPAAGLTRESAAAVEPLGGRRRRSAVGAVQEQRKAWGREWGGIVADYWKTLKVRRG